MDKEEILYWSNKYDKDHPWWTQEEKRLGDKFRKTKTLTKDDLLRVVDWKFKEVPPRHKRVSKFAKKNADEIVQRICNQVFCLTSKQDAIRIKNSIIFMVLVQR